MAGPSEVNKSSGSGMLGFIERIGNKLPDPVFLFIGATVIVMALSAIGSAMGWSVQPQRVKAVMEAVTLADGSVVQQAKLDASGKPATELVAAGSAVSPRNLLSVDGAYWLLANAVRNFINFAPLGVVLVGMFGIGVAEKVGLFGATMRWVASFVPSKALTPTIVFLGVVSNIASDAGYIVLPPLAAALYAAFKRPPLVGIAAAFAGVSAGFSANLLVGSTDALVAGITTLGARTLEPSYTVLATANWWFLIVSTFLLTLIGWA
ncbi:MAG: AbgT family transporter, partial [Phycisphaerales bacterium]